MRLTEYITKPQFIAQTTIMVGMGLMVIGAISVPVKAPPVVTQPHYATPAEERAWEVRQLEYAMDELAASRDDTLQTP